MPIEERTSTDILSACEMLEEEFRHIHRSSPPINAGSVSDGDRERAIRRAIHELPGDGRTALCLSGGGIRSATFCLGVLQGLAKRGWLERFHFLSTVSGGGYIGSWLSSWIHRENLPTVSDLLAQDPGGSDPEPKPISRLRAYSNFLSPVWGFSIDFITLISTFARNLLLHWGVFIPLLLGLLLLPRMNLSAVLWQGATPIGQTAALVLVLVGSLVAIAYAVSDLPGKSAHHPALDKYSVSCFVPILLSAVLLSWTWAWHVNVAEDSASDWGWYWYAAAGAVTHLTGVVVGLAWRWRRRVAPNPPVPGAPSQLVEGWRDAAIDFILVLGSGVGAGLLLFVGARFLFTPGWMRGQWPGPEIYACLGVPFLLGSFWMGTAFYAGLANRITTEGDREWWARAGAWTIFTSLAWIALNGLVIFGTQWALQSPRIIGSGGTLGGLAAGLVGYWNSKGLGRFSEQMQGALALTGRRLLDLAALAFIVVLLLALSLVVSIGVDRLPTAQAVYANVPLLDSGAYQDVLHRARPAAIILIAALAVCGGLGVAVSAVIGINTFSLHSMYGNRLVRAYLGATRRRRRPHAFTGFDPYDNLSMAYLVQEGRPLFHVVNIALNMVKATGGHLEWQQRKAASFTVSPLHAGSRSLDYRPTETYSGGVSLGRALTISGAAASPSMGYHSSPLVAFVMAFFNVRLGWWLPNPGVPGAAVWKRSEPGIGIGPLISESLSQTTDQSRYVYLSDGGHFENLGLYEMVYRRCRGIVVVDAGCDPDYEFEDLENAIRKIRVDLGIPITFPELPTPSHQRPPQERCVVGRIEYSAVDDGARDGVIIYIKPLLRGDEPIDVWRYAEANKAPGNMFPQQSTKDQFFDEAQFESYRELGRHSVLTAGVFNHRWPQPPVGSEDHSSDLAARDIIKRREEESGGPTKAFSLGSLPGWIALAAVPATAVYISLAPPKSDSGGGKTPEGVTQPIETRAPVVVVPPLADGKVDRVMLPFFEEASGCDGDPRLCKVGLKLDAGASVVLETLTRALVACQPVAGGKIRVEIRGYASSSEFAGSSDSDALNLKLANLRAENTWIIMDQAREKLPNGSRLDIALHTWETLDGMRDGRRYVDSVPAFSPDRGALNRRVDVYFDDLGQCSPKDVIGSVTQP